MSAEQGCEGLGYRQVVSGMNWSQDCKVPRTESGIHCVLSVPACDHHAVHTGGKWNRVASGHHARLTYLGSLKMETLVLSH